MRKQEQQGIAKAAQLRTQEQNPFGALGQAWALGGAQEEMFEAMRAAMPILDAAVGKLVRLTGGFQVKCRNAAAQEFFLQHLKNGGLPAASDTSQYLNKRLVDKRLNGLNIIRSVDHRIASSQFLV